jgi:hypothetical protein
MRRVAERPSMRKHFTCHRCGQQVGFPYVRFRGRVDGKVTTYIMHPECWDAVPEIAKTGIRELAHSGPAWVVEADEK